MRISSDSNYQKLIIFDLIVCKFKYLNVILNSIAKETNVFYIFKQNISELKLVFH